jgi:hypothetical protein
MQKKRINRDLLFVLTAAAVCFGFMSFVTVVFPAVKMSFEGLIKTYEMEVSGIHAVFGGKVTGGNEYIELTFTEYKFNFLTLFGYLLPLIASIGGVLIFKSKKDLPHYVVAGLCFLGAILIFLEPVLFRSVNEIADSIKVSLLVGPVIGGLLALVAGAFNIGCGVMKR